MENTILKVENLSKQYRLGQVGVSSLKDDIKRFSNKIIGKEDPFLKIGDVNDRSVKKSSQYVWALRDINFDVYKGEVVGIIGKNGAGKSTLLKILSRVTGPTIGEIKFNGRIASLLEVGTGFHPEMTGKENVFLNGAILGMTKKEIDKKLDDIIAFSGCEKYIDTPVKRYSSGMRVRLAFAVAAFLEPDILIVDEVLAVGDAEFQKRAIGKMQDISSSSGRTVLFVSHNMSTIKSLCSRVIVIDNGNVVYNGNVNTGIEHYYSLSKTEVLNFNLEDRKRGSDLGKQLRIVDLTINNDASDNNKDCTTGEPFYVKFKIKNLSEINFTNISLTASIFNTDGGFLFSLRSDCIDKTYDLSKLSEGVYTCKVDKLPLNLGEYVVNINCSSNDLMLDSVHDALFFNVREGDFYGTGRLPAKKRKGVYIDYNWD